MTIRPYRPADRAAVHEICVATGHEGGDARGVYKDPEILPEIFAEPHLEFEPELAFVLEAGGEVVGYVLGTADTRRHAERFRERWLPEAARKFPALSGPPADLDEFMVALLHQPERKVRAELAAYPAHLHIDILPEFQGSGHGRELIHAFLDALAAAGVSAVHLSTLKTNVDSLAFYARLGFEPLPVEHPKLQYLGRSTAR